VKQLLGRMFEDAHERNIDNIRGLIRSYGIEPQRFCDLGAGDGSVTQRILHGLSYGTAHAVEVEPENARRLEAAGFAVHVCDLNARLPLDSDYFDVVVANQVIEHLYDTELFLDEVRRVVRPGGIAVISTENLASWHNIGALIFGWQPFSLTNVSRRVGGLGNPAALHRNENGWPFPMQHHRLFTTRTMRELMLLHDFTDVRVRGSGYYPLPASFGSAEKQHAHFITVAGRRSASQADR
jgi:2-polyprenyl-3-methyl-5-hydroxy-6-metoxy-1,4-benzoquinol methylase